VKKGIIILLSLLIVFVAFKDLITYAHFFLNRTFITQNYCQNIDQPQLMCHGKCYLETSIQQNQEQQQDVPNPVMEEKTNIVFLPFDNQFSISNNQREGNQPIFQINDCYTFTHLYQVFHPPRIV